MGLQDRDYMHERHRARPPAPAGPSRTAVLTWVLAFVSAAYLIHKAADTWLASRTPPGRSEAPATAAEAPPAPPAPRVDQEAAVPGAAWQRCVVQGRTMYSDQGCPDGTPAVAPTPAPVARESEAAPGTRVLYHCTSYAGATFWTTAHCHQRQALVDRMVNVPAQLGFEQQVQIAEQQRQQGDALVRTARQTQPQPATPGPAGPSVTCAALAARIEQLDAMSRQPQTLPTLDMIRRERKETRDAQFRLRC